MSDYVELKEFAAVIWRRKWLIVSVTFLAATTAFVASSLMTPVYEASTVLFVNQVTDPRSYDFGPVPTSERLARTYAEMLTTRPMLEESMARLGLGIGHGGANRSAGAQLVKDTQLIELNVQDTDPVVAAELANTIVEVFAGQFDALQASRFAASKASLSAQLEKLAEQIRATEDQVEALNPVQAAGEQANEENIAGLSTAQTNDRSAELERRLAELTQYRVSYTNLLLSFEELRMAEAQSASNIVQVEPAKPPGAPIRPRTMLNTLLASVVGGMLALGIAFVIDRSDDTLTSADEAARVTQLPVIGYVADSKELMVSDTRKGLMISEPNSPLAESFRSVRTNLELGGTQGTPRSILVSSPEPHDGKTTIAAQLAVSMAHGGKKVVLIDANLRQPKLHEYFGIKNTLGLSDMLVDDLVPQVVAQQSIHWRLRVITSGKPVDNPAELMGSIWMLKVLTRLREQADVAIFDGPPFLVADSFILASKLESVLIVLQAGKTREAVVLRMMEQLDRAHATVLGLVMNRVPARVAYGLAGHLVYGYGADPIGTGLKEDTEKRARRPVVLRNHSDPFIEETGR